MKPSHAPQPIAGLCVGCQKPTQRMPLCVQCIAVWEADGDRWTYVDPHSQAIRDKANQWLRQPGAAQ